VIVCSSQSCAKRRILTVSLEMLELQTPYSWVKNNMIFVFCVCSKLFVLAYRAFLDCAPPRDVLINEVRPGLERLKPQLHDETSLTSVTAALVTIDKLMGEGVDGTSSQSTLPTTATQQSSNSAGSGSSDNIPPSPTPKPEDSLTMQRARGLLERFRLGGTKDKAVEKQAEQKE
jgi:hypothetical protein